MTCYEMDGWSRNVKCKQIFDIILAIYVHRWDEKKIYIIDPTDI